MQLLDVKGAQSLVASEAQVKQVYNWPARRVLPSLEGLAVAHLAQWVNLMVIVLGQEQLLVA
jgi:hypothetical protein